jgi:hypothetical protein
VGVCARGECGDAELRREIADLIRRIRDPGDALAEVGEVFGLSLCASAKASSVSMGFGLPWPRHSPERARCA